MRAPQETPSRLEGRRLRGACAEILAAALLGLRGCELLGWRRRVGGVEVDLLARRKGLVLVVEVKSRSEPAATPAEALVSREQLRRLERAADAVSLKHGLPARVDLVEVRWRRRRWPVVRWHQGPWAC